ncbi:hypothetical protein [Fischerella thermalis]
MRLRFQSQGEFLNIWDAPREKAEVRRRKAASVGRQRAEGNPINKFRGF